MVQSIRGSLFEERLALVWIGIAWLYNDCVRLYMVLHNNIALSSSFSRCYLRIYMFMYAETCGTLITYSTFMHHTSVCT